MKSPSDLAEMPATVVAVLDVIAVPVVTPDDDETVAQGERHEALLAWARSRFTAKGVLGRPALDGMRGHNATAIRPPLPDEEVERLWKHLERTRIAERERATQTVYRWGNYGDDNPRNKTWLWHPYLPLGKLVLVGGAPGHGKSQLTALFAAHTTRATFFNSDLKAPGRVILLSAEDDPEDTISPRLMAANADLRLVERVNTERVYHGLKVRGQITLPDDVFALQERIARGDVRLLVLDPAPSFVSRSHSTLVNQDVRAVLEPLKELAERYQVTIVFILHLNKAAEIREFSARVAESHGFMAVVRTALALGPDPDDEEGEAGSRKVLALAKSNLVRRARRSLRCEIVETVVQDRAGADVTTEYLRLIGPSDATADDLLMNDDQRHAFQSAREWLHDFLADAWRKAGDVEAAALKAGHSKRTIERIRAQDCRRQKQAGVTHGPWWIALASTPLADLGPGGLDGLGVVTESTPPTPPGPNPANGNSAGQPRQPRQTVIDLNRERDRRLGEAWEEDDS